MTYFKKIVFAILLFVANITLHAEDNGFYFIQMTDPQFGFYAAVDKTTGFAKETANMEKAIAAINRLNPAFIVFTGDLVNNADDEAQLNEYMRLRKKIKKEIPVYELPGNHDVGNDAKEENVVKYINRYGYDCFSFKLHNCCFVGFNTQFLYGNNKEREWKQRIWLQHTLENAQQCNHRIVFSHYPLFVNQFDEKHKYENIPMNMRSIYLDLFDKLKVDYMFVGHLHHNSIGKYKNLHVIGTGAVGFPIGEGVTSGIRVVKVYPDRVESEFYELDKIPSKIKM